MAHQVLGLVTGLSEHGLALLGGDTGNVLATLKRLVLDLLALLLGGVGL